MIISNETLEFLHALLMQVQISASAPNFEETAGKIITAKQELESALAVTPMAD